MNSVNGLTEKFIQTGGILMNTNYISTESYNILQLFSELNNDMVKKHYLMTSELRCFLLFFLYSFFHYLYNIINDSNNKSIFISILTTNLTKIGGK